MPRGGYQKPTNGAVVSPPGALSKRKAVENNAKENIPSDGNYGERKAIQEQLRGGPIAKVEPVKKLSINVSPTPTAAKEKLGTFTDPTQRPEEAFSNGFSFGEGLRPTDIGLPMGTGQPDSEQKQDLMQLSSFLPIFRNVANMEGTPRGFRTFTKYLESL
jgi:hypothetical protein